MMVKCNLVRSSSGHAARPGAKARWVGTPKSAGPSGARDRGEKEEGKGYEATLPLSLSTFFFPPPPSNVPRPPDAPGSEKEDRRNKVTSGKSASFCPCQPDEIRSESYFSGKRKRRRDPNSQEWGRKVEKKKPFFGMRGAGPLPLFSLLPRDFVILDGTVLWTPDNEEQVSVTTSGEIALFRVGVLEGIKVRKAR